MLALLGLIGAIAVGVVVGVRGGQSTAQPRRSADALPSSAGRRPLTRKLQPFLSAHPGPELLVSPVRGRGPELLVPPIQGQACFVGPGGCSETPCVVPVQTHGIRSVSAVSTAVPRPVSAVPVAAATGTIVPFPVRPALTPGRGCPSRQALPRTFRVVGP